jgi:hypothetical protein
VLVALQIGINKLVNVVGVNLAQNGRNVVLMSKCGSLKNMNDGIMVARRKGTTLPLLVFLCATKCLCFIVCIFFISILVVKILM